MIGRLHKQVPYIVVLLAASYLFFLTTRFDFSAPGGRIGPDFWPKAILLLAMITCAYEIVKNLFFAGGRRDLAGVLESIIEEAPAEQVQQAPPPAFLPLLIGGMALTIAYVVLIDKLGFFLCTFLYLAAFMWIGRYRRHGVILATSLIGSLVFVFVFMKVVYVSLPLGVEPFAQVSFFLMRVMGIR